MKKTITMVIMLMMLMIQPSCSAIGGSAQNTSPQSDYENIEEESVTKVEDVLSEDDIKEIVLQQASGSVESDIIMLECEYDDGECQYEGKVYNNGRLYEFEISGEDGNILEWEIDD